MENALRHERSPYLLQHKSNPVDWLPWGDEARRRAQDQDKPILLSIGYAACHWCHVMATESFSDSETAALMNALFVNVKVDREQRPDVDAFCIQALQSMGKRPGWPLTMFLTPDGKPFWGGTYFPREERDGLPAFMSVLRKIGELYRSDRDTVQARADSFIASFAEPARASGARGELTNELIIATADDLLSKLDLQLGGLRGKPKFAYPPLLRFLWNTGHRTGRKDLQAAVAFTLDRILDGGIYDQLGGGVARYAVDESWLIPHFEKMLYDNAQLVGLLADLWRETRHARYERAARETVEWLLREMTLPGGGFASSLSAVSEGGEGRYYLWQEAEIDRLLGPDSALFKRFYDVSAQGNFEGRNVLNRVSRAVPTALEEEKLTGCRATLLDARSKRPPPQRDDMVLADWNGLAISAFAKAGLIFDESAWVMRAQEAFDFVTRHLTVDGELYHIWYEGDLQSVRILDDYAQMARGALALYEATAEQPYLEQCERWVAGCMAVFLDRDSGALAFSADASIPARLIEGRDTVTPSGNGTMCEVLARLYHLTGSEHYRERCEQILGGFAARAREDGFQLATLMEAAQGCRSTMQVVIIGEREHATTHALSRVAYEQAAPDAIVVVLQPGAAVPGAAAAKQAARAAPTAYVCIGATCLAPSSDPASLEATLSCEGIGSLPEKFRQDKV